MPLVSVVGDVLMPALSVELLRVAQGAGGHILRTTEGSGEVSGGTVAAVAMRTGALSFPVEADGAFRIHFAGYQPERVTPAARVLEAEGIDPELQARVAGRIVLVGSSAQGLFDIRTTPIDPAIAGVTLHAEIIEQIVAGEFLGRPDWMPGLELLLVVLAGLVLTGLQLRERPVLGLAAALVLITAPVLGGILAFGRAGLLFDPVLPTLTALAVFLPGTAIGFLAKERARRAIRARFAYFLPPALIGQIEANPEAALTPAGAERELSVMFVDMRGFFLGDRGHAARPRGATGEHLPFRRGRDAGRPGRHDRQVHGRRGDGLLGTRPSRRRVTPRPRLPRLAMWRRRRPRRRRTWRPRAIRRCASPSGSTPARPMSGSWGPATG